MKECRRRSIRFPLEFPAHLHWQVGPFVHTVRTHTKNISRSGLYLMMQRGYQPSSRVEFEVELPTSQTGETSALLRGKGRLIRREDFGDGVSGIAAVIHRYELITTTLPGALEAPEQAKPPEPSGRNLSKKPVSGPAVACR